MSVLDELTIKETCAKDILLEATDVDTYEEYAYTMYMDTVTNNPSVDVRATIDMLYEIFYASHNVFRFCIESITVSNPNTRIQENDIPSRIQIIKSEHYEETTDNWSRYKIAVSFDFKLKYRNPRITVFDDEHLASEYSILRLMNQLVHVCIRLKDSRTEWVRRDDYSIIIKNNENSLTYEIETRPTLINLCMSPEKMRFNFKVLLRKMHDGNYSTDSELEEIVYRYNHRSELYRIKHNDWTVKVLLTPTPLNESLRNFKNLNHDFYTSYNITIKGYNVKDMYVRFNLLRSVCEFSAFNKLFVPDVSIHTYGELFWRMCPRIFRDKIETYFDEKNFSNMNQAHWLLKQILDAYDQKGYSAAVDVIEKEFNSKLLPDKVNVNVYESTR